MSDTASAPPRYFSRSWKMLTSQKGWYKPVMLLALGMFVPLFGLLALVGYGLEWARLTAWNVDSAPKQKGVAVGKCIVVGWRAIVVMFVWNLLWAIATGLMHVIFDTLGLNGLVSTVVTIAALFFDLVVTAACVRSAIYTKIAPGLSFSRIWEMLKRDYKGLFTIAGITIVSALIVVAIAFVGVLILFAICLPDVAWILEYLMYVDSITSYEAAELVGYVTPIILKSIPVCLLIAYAGNFVTVMATLLKDNAVGLWMRQFDVARWGGPYDPLPEVASDAFDQDEDDEPPVSPVTAETAADEKVNPSPVCSPAADDPVVVEAEVNGGVEGDGPVAPEPAATSVLDETIAAEAAAFAMKQTAKGEGQSTEGTPVPAGVEKSTLEDEVVTAVEAKPEVEEAEAGVIEDDVPPASFVTSTHVVVTETTDEFGDTKTTRTVETYDSNGSYEKTVEDDTNPHEVITTLIPPHKAGEDAAGTEGEESTESAGENPADSE